MKPNETILKTAYVQAQKAFKEDEVPVGAVIYNSNTGEIISTAYNETEKTKNPLAHAEILAIQKACETLNTKRLNGYSLFVTLEPCVMCAGAISLARLDAVYFGAFDPKTGAVLQGAEVFKHTQTHHKPIVLGGLNADENGKILTDFFKAKRK
ncbi:MAG: nucleoside deaminase [Alphaproteobacteria bacterium]|nr:nucleoside deaminase [Alphaproteobacteria bacterium]